MSPKTNKSPYLMPVYNRFDVAFERGEGAYLFDEDGNRYLDFCSGIAVTLLGHSHPHLIKALEEQGGKLWHTSNLFKIPGQEKLAQRLVEATFADSVFFTNSGVESIECSIKLARKYHSDHGHPERYRIITFSKAFHGRSLAAISAAQSEKMTKGFGPMLQGFDQVPFIDVDAVKKSITKETAAILIEPVQGEGGILPAVKEDIQQLRQIADEHGILLILDEIQCGMGRTGKLFAYEWFDTEPDIMAIAKGVGGGFPLGACLARGSVGAALSIGSHGTTYGGNPLGMAIGNAVLDVVLQDQFLPHVEKMSSLLFERLGLLKEKHPDIIKDVRGLGLMIGVECAVETRPLIADAIKDGLILAPSGTHVLRLLPPLIIDEGHIREAIEKIDKLIASIKLSKKKG